MTPARGRVRRILLPGKVPGNRSSKSTSFSQAAAPEGPVGDAPLPAPELGPPSAAYGDGSSGYGSVRVGSVKGGVHTRERQTSRQGPWAAPGSLPH